MRLSDLGATKICVSGSGTLDCETTSKEQPKYVYLAPEHWTVKQLGQAAIRQSVKHCFVYPRLVFSHVQIPLVHW